MHCWPIITMQTHLTIWIAQQSTFCYFKHHQLQQKRFIVLVPDLLTSVVAPSASATAQQILLEWARRTAWQTRVRDLNRTAARASTVAAFERSVSSSHHQSHLVQAAQTLSHRLRLLHRPEVNKKMFPVTGLKSSAAPIPCSTAIRVTNPVHFRARATPTTFGSSVTMTASRSSHGSSLRRSWVRSTAQRRRIYSSTKEFENAAALVIDETTFFVISAEFEIFATSAFVWSMNCSEADYLFNRFTCQMIFELF